ncbi:MAG TPA: peroxiredoxin [Tepidisphaeraceae bacterium]|nr:peroxiredoxin [Tepidisphaeraceae bacterium]
MKRSITIAGYIAVTIALSAVLQAQTTHPVTELKVGDMAPNFTLQGSNGKTYSLADFKDKKAVVIAWFPAAFTQGCTIECKSLADNGEKIKQFDVTYFMASVDPVAKNTDFAHAQNADFPLLSDPDKKTAEAFGVLNARGVANRWTFYIGKDGKILAIEKAVKPATSAEDMVKKLGELGVAKTASN